MPFRVRVTVEGDGFGREYMVNRVNQVLTAAGLPMEQPSPPPKPARHLRVITASGEQQ